MTPRWELQLVRLNGETYPALIDHNDANPKPFVFYAKDKPGYKELVKLFAEYGRGCHLQTGFPVWEVLKLPHYLSDETVDKIMKANKGAKK